MRTKLVRRRVRKPPPPKPAGPIIIDNPVDYQLAVRQQKQQVVLGRGTSDLSLDGKHDLIETTVGNDEEAKQLAEFLRPKTFSPDTDSSNASRLGLSKTRMDTIHEKRKDNKV